MRKGTSRGITFAAGAIAFAMTLSACSGTGDNTPTAEPTAGGTETATETEAEPSGEDIELTVNVFGNGGYEGDASGNNNLFRLYEEQNPGIIIKEQNLGQGGDALTATLNAIGAGGVGLPDVQMIEEGWLGQMSELSDQFVDLGEYGAADLADRWVDWKFAQGTSADGTVWAYGTDIGPQGLCYNATLLEESGIAADRDEFAAALGGDDATWEDFWTVGKKFTDETGVPWLGVSAFAMNSFVNQQDEGYYKADGSLNTDNPAIKDFLGQIIDATNSGLTAKINSWDWSNEAFQGDFAVHVCPGWMLGSIEAGVTSGDQTWDFADVFPGGATNWGGSFFSVPTVTEHAAEAAALADWLTAPEQQIIAFQNAGAFPSQISAQSDPAVTGFTNSTFNDAPVGEILASRAEGVVAQFKGPQDAVIQDTVMGGVISEINAGQITDLDSAWERFQALLQENGIG
ncbi:cellobiose transport system substrate-binding protein [Ruaniaceae bacterium KH17]|nr:cellobiose transport system substrate-binding protein [Ruaniaceae bacterium KH17]